MRPARPQALTRLPTDPTPEEIKACCLEIQSAWTQADLVKRAGSMPSGIRPDEPGVEITVIAVRDLG